MNSFPRIIIPVILVIVAIAAFVWSCRIPSDSLVQERFIKDKAVLTVLLDRLSQEPHRIVGITKDDVMVDDTSNWITPEKANFSRIRFSEYKALMDQAHINQLFRSDDGIHFAIAGVGFASEGWRLDFTYTKIAPSPLVQSIDSPPRPISEDGAVIYRPLGDDWYIRLIY
jgi:hypothetical protein